jgi:glyceraldehyde-3-phosphate dehydrogenase/erythrose-4-phosphate dehydrogenase
MATELAMDSNAGSYRDCDPQPHDSVSNASCRLNRLGADGEGAGQFVGLGQGSDDDHSRLPGDQSLLDGPHRDRPPASSTHISTMADGELGKALGWYDSKFGYVTRLADFVQLVVAEP